MPTVPNMNLTFHGSTHPQWYRAKSDGNKSNRERAVVIALEIFTTLPNKKNGFHNVSPAVLVFCCRSTLFANEAFENTANACVSAAETKQLAFS